MLCVYVVVCVCWHFRCIKIFSHLELGSGHNAELLTNVRRYIREVYPSGSMSIGGQVTLCHASCFRLIHMLNVLILLYIPVVNRSMSDLDQVCALNGKGLVSGKTTNLYQPQMGDKRPQVMGIELTYTTV